MRIEITTKNLDLTPALREFTEKKIGSLQKFVKRFEENSEVKCFIELAKTTEHHNHGEIFYAEANVEIEGENGLLRIEENSNDMHAAIDGLKDRLKQELLILKSKKVDKKRKVQRPNKP